MFIKKIKKPRINISERIEDLKNRCILDVVNYKFTSDGRIANVIGHETELKCFSKCSSLGFIISQPMFEDSPYDFILDLDNTLLKIQVKHSDWIDRERGIFRFSAERVNGKKYTSNEVDFFMTEKEGLFFLIPFCDVSKGAKTLRLFSNPGDISEDSIGRAEDYLFESTIKALMEDKDD